MAKTNEGLYLINKTNCEDALHKIELMFGPFSDDEINFYMSRLENDSGNVINDFQKSLIFNLFYKYFGDPVSINNINKIGYVKLVIAASRLLKANNMIIMPYIISPTAAGRRSRLLINGIKKAPIAIKNKNSASCSVIRILIWQHKHAVICTRCY